MPLRRVGYGSDFVIKNQNVGIGTTNPTAKLQVGGTLKGELNITGVSDFASYNGFAGQKQNVSVASTIGFTTTGVGTFTQPNERETGFLSLVGEYNTVSEDLIVDEGKIFEVSTTNITGITTLGTQEVYAPDDSVVSVGTLESVSIQSHFGFPDGGINDRPDQPTEGMVRFNDDLNTLEFYNGIEWRQFTVSGASGRGVFGGGRAPNHTTSMESIQIHTLGNGVNFGDLQNNSTYKFPNSSSVRGIFSGGYEPSPTFATDTINYITIASAGNAVDFGNLVTSNGIGSGASSSTRGLQIGGYVAAGTNSNVIQYIEMSTTGNSIDFGDTSTSLRGWGAANSATRAIMAGGDTGSVKTSGIEYVTISSLGNSKDFGDLTRARRLDNQNASSSVRGVFMGGGWGSQTDTIDYVTIASTGNAIDFGKLSVATALPATCSSQTRGIAAGGLAPGAPGGTNVMDYVTIASTGNAQDFGDLNQVRHAHTGISDSHGGLGGF